MTRTGEKHGVLLTGMPGVGKTTIIRRVAGALAGRNIRGFTTQEIRSSAQRLGFRLETHDGKSAVLAHVNIQSRFRVGKYGVDIAALEAVVAQALALDPAVELYLVDEIGKMECLSSRFVAAMTALLDSQCPLVATVALRGSGLIEQAKRRGDVELWQVMPKNRNEVPNRVICWLDRFPTSPQNGSPFAR